ncbi:hypothetical protein GY45DRAFT_141474 [Cubamyces sp. BRFM 1775]|nr:hypothetical protein GY45DRAFT_141474 [Cubamyces sp. BRFM 1775]
MPIRISPSLPAQPAPAPPSGVRSQFSLRSRSFCASLRSPFPFLRRLALFSPVCLLINPDHLAAYVAVPLLPPSVCPRLSIQSPLPSPAFGAPEPITVISSPFPHRWHVSCRALTQALCYRYVVTPTLHSIFRRSVPLSHFTRQPSDSNCVLRPDSASVRYEHHPALTHPALAMKLAHR